MSVALSAPDDRLTVQTVIGDVGIIATTVPGAVTESEHALVSPPMLRLRRHLASYRYWSLARGHGHRTCQILMERMHSSWLATDVCREPSASSRNGVTARVDAESGLRPEARTQMRMRQAGNSTESDTGD